MCVCVCVLYVGSFGATGNATQRKVEKWKSAVRKKRWNKMIRQSYVFVMRVNSQLIVPPPPSLDAQLSHIDVPFPIFILPYDTYKFVIHLYTLSYSVYELQTSEYLIIWLTSACLQEYCLRYGVHVNLFFIQANGS